MVMTPSALSWIILGTGLILSSLLFLFCSGWIPSLESSNPSLKPSGAFACGLRCWPLPSCWAWVWVQAFAQTKQSLPTWLWAEIITGSLAGLALLVLLIRRSWHGDTSSLRPWEIGLGIANVAGLLLVVAWSNWTAQPPPEALLVMIMLGMAVVVLLGVIRLADIHADRDVVPDAAGILFGTLGLLLVGVML